MKLLKLKSNILKNTQTSENSLESERLNSLSFSAGKKVNGETVVEKLEKDNSDLRNRIEKLEKLIEENK